MGLVLSWRHGQRSYTFVKQANQRSIPTPIRSEFDVVENGHLIGLYRHLRQCPKWEWQLLFAIEGRFTSRASIHWTKAQNPYAMEGVSKVQLPGRLAFRLALRCSWKPAGRLCLFLEPHVLLVKPSRFDYIPLPDSGGDKIFVGETRCTMGADLGIELGPLFSHAPSHANAQ